MTILGLIAFICRIFDAVTDPWIASLSDRSANPKGRRIPFMKRAAIPFALITVLVFFAPVTGVSGVNIAWVLCTLILFYLFMTIFCTPYNALIAELGDTQQHRINVSTYISFTFIAGQSISFMLPNVASMLQGTFGQAGSVRMAVALMAGLACAAMLVESHRR